MQQAPVQQQAPAQQAPAQQNWGQPQQAPVQQQAPLQTQQLDPANPWGQAPGAQPQQAPQTGAPIQPNVAGGDALSAFQGWDD